MVTYHNRTLIFGWFVVWCGIENCGHRKDMCLMGASTIKYMEKVLRYTKTLNFRVKHLKVGAKYCLIFNFLIFFIPLAIVVLGTQK